MSKNKEWLFSVIVPVYNTEQYLPEAIGSLLAQSIGFADHIQVVLVNDGSTDSSAQICGEFASKYTENIVFINKENTGVSDSRNRGLAATSGRYINFFDSDDKWSEDAFAEFARFFSENPDVQIAACRHTFFGSRTGPHPLSFKFEHDHVIDVTSDYEATQHSFSNLVLSRELLGLNPFNPELSVSEDFLAINRILLVEHRYGALSRPVYWYRRVEGSAIATSESNISWYFDTPRLVYLSLLRESQRQHTHRYIQQAVMYDLQWRIKQDPRSCPLDSEQLLEYRDLLVNVLTHIDDDIILNQRSLFREHKLYALALKYGTSTAEIQKGLVIDGDHSAWSAPCDLPAGDSKATPSQPRLLRTPVAPLAWDAPLTIEGISLHHGILRIEGVSHSFFLPSALSIIARSLSGATLATAVFTGRVDKAVKSVFGEVFYVPLGFVLKFPAQSAEFFLEIDGKEFRSSLRTGKFCELEFRTHSYCRFGSFILTSTKAGINVEPYSRRALMKREAIFTAARLKHQRDDSLRLLPVRHRAFTAELTGSKEHIWLISDSSTRAGDNGQALFEYLMKHPVPGVKAYFVISSEADDFAKMKTLGPVVLYLSKKHLELTLRAEYVISSAGEDVVFNPFMKNKLFSYGFAPPRFVFLQHGVTLHDQSNWLRRSNKNISLLITASPRERASFLENPAYGYSEQQIVGTGFPRHDKLIRRAATALSDKRTILIAPTWRREFEGEADAATTLRKPFPGFEETDYCRFFQRLINDADLEAAARKNGLEVRFLLHPAHRAELRHFSSDFATIATDYDYTQEFLDAAIMVTDYSSVAFDFALLKKPVLYTQPDRNRFYSHQLYSRGYFDYAADGFGPVALDYAATMRDLLRFIPNPVMDDVYQQDRKSVV